VFAPLALALFTVAIAWQAPSRLQAKSLPDVRFLYTFDRDMT
jgi:hypothetical protein